MKDLKFLALIVILNTLMGAVMAHAVRIRLVEMRVQLDANRTQIKELREAYYQHLQEGPISVQGSGGNVSVGCNYSMPVPTCKVGETLIYDAISEKFQCRKMP